MHNKRRANFHVNRQSDRQTEIQHTHTYTDTITYLGQLPKMCSIPFWGRFQHYLHLAIRFSVWTFCCLAFSAFFILSVCLSSSATALAPAPAPAPAPALPFRLVFCVLPFGALFLVRSPRSAMLQLQSSPRFVLAWLLVCYLVPSRCFLCVVLPHTHTHTELYAVTHTQIFFRISRRLYLVSVVCLAVSLCCVSCGPCVYAYQLVCVCVCLSAYVFACFVCACCSLVARGAFMMCA